ncbi:MAG: RNA polymerase-associated protein RapA, partial [Acidiferrobacterales bacterium]
MTEYIAGQRWISSTELEMGLGTVLQSDFRTVTILYPATAESRTYAKESAPLTRVLFTKGDEVQSQQGWSCKVDSVNEADGLVTYVGRDSRGEKIELHERDLDNHIQLNRPTDRLYSSIIDQSKWFDLRLQTLIHANRLAHSDLRGLGGCRTALIPHQIFIAHEVANRYAPRVMLADEVGLGKTIEAGLILHHQLLTGRTRRVLIVVPESLVHQWLVEMLRRFNLKFSIFDEERCLALEEGTDFGNPFHAEQLILCSLEFLVSQPDRAKQSLGGEWDLLVVDEAHHLQWSPGQASPEYSLVEKLSQNTKGVLLLTATPEQLGKESHFARLRLLDADRFGGFDAFVSEEKGYEPVAQAVEDLLGGVSISETSRQTLTNTVGEGDNKDLLDRLATADTPEADRTEARQALIEHLLDRHGTGRILFRNTRNAVKGFPDRRANLVELPVPTQYAETLKAFQNSTLSEPQLLLCPELLYQSVDETGQVPWTGFDPRINWLVEKLEQLKTEKVLVIAASADTAMDIAQVLRVDSGIHAALFHEGLSILERDRAAAFFADPEEGTQVLICSEIGSEGRNFQFAHHLVLFDLPLNPDLLEQRIGRLDRIGQHHTIEIHVPWLKDTAQEIMCRWYHEGLSAFEHTCPAGHNVFVQVQSSLVESLHQIDAGIEDLDALIATTKNIHETLNEELHRGRDRLLEYNSCLPHVANSLKEQCQELDRNSELPAYLELVFDCFGVDSEIHGAHSFVIRPTEHNQVSLPGLSTDGMTITYERDSALANEDMHFLTWEHPMVGWAMDMVQSSELGNTAFAAIKSESVASGTLLLECLFILETVANEQLQGNRYLPPTMIRVVVDKRGIEYGKMLTRDIIMQSRIAVESEVAQNLVRSQIPAIRNLVAIAEQQALKQAPDILQAAHTQTKQTLQKEINRLKALKKVNPNVRDEEIEFFETQWQALEQVLDSAAPRLDALRVIV